MDFKEVAEQAIKLAKVAGTVLPGLSGGAAIAEKIIDIVDGLADKAPLTETQEELQAAARELRAVTSAKAQATANRLD